ncbi:MAG: hypothetical protein KAR25_07100, partial [Methanosarcinales archaeon]|nr:hypothetical protein [Methanosarcinales archaeon]
TEGATVLVCWRSGVPCPISIWKNKGRPLGKLNVEVATSELLGAKVKINLTVLAVMKVLQILNLQLPP